MARTSKNKTKKSETEMENEIKRINVEINNLNIRKGPGKNFETIGKFATIGINNITEISKGKGSKKGWGHLEDGDGWVSLDFVEIL